MIALRTLGSVLLVLCATTLACSSKENASSDDDDDGDSTKVSDDDCSSRCTVKVEDCGYSGEQAEQGCDKFCQSITKKQLTCFESKTCSVLEKASTLESLCPAESAGDDDDDDDVNPSTCDGKAFCKDSQTRAVCNVEGGIEGTDYTECVIGTCNEGKCGACTSDATCKNKTTICYCKDGTNVTADLTGSCDDGYCSISLASGGPFCEDHGGPDEDRGDPVYHCSDFWKDN